MITTKNIWLLALLSLPFDLALRHSSASFSGALENFSNSDQLLTEGIHYLGFAAALVTVLTAHRPILLRNYVRLLNWGTAQRKLARRYSGILVLLAAGLTFVEILVRVIHLPPNAIVASCIVLLIGGWRLRREFINLAERFRSTSATTSEVILRRRSLHISLLMLLPVLTARIAAWSAIISAPSLFSATIMLVVAIFVLLLLRPEAQAIKTTCRVCWRPGPVVALQSGLCLYGCGPEAAVLGQYSRPDSDFAAERKVALAESLRQAKHFSSNTSKPSWFSLSRVRHWLATVGH